MTTKNYEVSGLILRSEIPLRATPAELAPVDATVRAGSLVDDIPWERPSPSVIAELLDPRGWPRYSFCSMSDGSTKARFYALADFDLNDGMTEIVCHRHPNVSEGMAGLLVAGGIVAYIRSLNGDCVLHASAVEIAPGRAAAFVGPTGRGKTTCATLLCAEGCGLVTDDVLVLTPSAQATMCMRGSAELRVRPQQVDLLSRFKEAPSVSPTPDERFSVRPARLASDDLELAAIVIPDPSRESSRPDLERLSAAAAVGVLLSIPRIEGWRAPDHLAQLFAHATAVASTVPVFSCRVPWGAPVPPDVGEQLMHELTRVIDFAAA